MTLTARAGSIVAIALFCIATAHAAFPVPDNDGFITDTVGILTSEQDAELERILTDYRATTSNEIAVLVVDTLSDEPIADAAVATLRKWGVGNNEKNNGVLLLIAYGDRKVFLATGYGLEGAIPDITAKKIIDQELLPQFSDGAYYDGIHDAVSAIIQTIGGEYTADEEEGNTSGILLPSIILGLYLLINVLRVLGVILARSKSWWLGGLIGGGFGVIFSLITGAWWVLILLVIVGFVFDYFVSKYGYSPRSRYRRGGSRWIGGSGGWGGGGGGGFSGFGGGSSGGGGAGGSW